MLTNATQHFAELKNLRARIIALETENAWLFNDGSASRSAVAEHRKENEAAQQRIATLEADRDRLETANAELTTERDTARKQNASMTDALKKAYADLEDMEIDRERLLDRLADAHKCNATLEAANAELNAENTKLRTYWMNAYAFSAAWKAAAKRKNTAINLLCGTIERSLEWTDDDQTHKLSGLMPLSDKAK